MTRRYRPHGEGSATGAEEHALALESAWSRNAYGARHTEDLYEVMRSVENPTGNNNLPAVDRGWRVGLVTNIAKTCSPWAGMHAHPFDYIQVRALQGRTRGVEFPKPSDQMPMSRDLVAERLPAGPRLVSKPRAPTEASDEGHHHAHNHDAGSKA